MTTPNPPASEDMVEIVLVFDYTIQRVPTRNNRKIQTKKSGTKVYLSLRRECLNAEGIPEPRALWFAESMFLKELKNKHLPDVRVMHWQSHLEGSTKILSDYRVLLSATLD